MSFRLQERVWDLKMHPHEQHVLHALARFADDDGHNCYPSVGRVARMTNFSERSVQRIFRKLEAKGLLVRTNPPHRVGQHGTPYEIHLGNGLLITLPRGAILSPLRVVQGVTLTTPRGDILSPDSVSTLKYYPLPHSSNGARPVDNRNPRAKGTNPRAVAAKERKATSEQEQAKPKLIDGVAHVYRDGSWVELNLAATE